MEAITDTQRVDWIASNADRLQIFRDGYGATWFAYLPDKSVTPWQWSNAGKDLRRLIDRAIRNDKKLVKQKVSTREASAE